MSVNPQQKCVVQRRHQMRFSPCFTDAIETNEPNTQTVEVFFFDIMRTRSLMESTRQHCILGIV